jgi:hypothetical protein
MKITNFLKALLGNSDLFKSASELGYSEAKPNRPKRTKHRTAEQQARLKRNRVSNKSRAINFRRAK